MSDLASQTWQIDRIDALDGGEVALYSNDKLYNRWAYLRPRIRGTIEGALVMWDGEVQGSPAYIMRKPAGGFV